MRLRRVGFAIILIGSIGVALAGCEVTVARADLEKQVAEHIGKATGDTVESVECPGDLRAEEGLELECTVATTKETMRVTVSVTSVDGAEILYEIDEQPT